MTATLSHSQRSRSHEPERVADEGVRRLASLTTALPLIAGRKRDLDSALLHVAQQSITLRGPLGASADRRSPGAEPGSEPTPRRQVTVSSVTLSDPVLAPGLGRRGISEALRRFAAEMPYERQTILDFVMKVASDTKPDTTVLDLGAGDAPYRELFARTNYLTSDWENSVHAAGRRADVVADASALPLESSSVGLVLCTQVLEHIADPAALLGECLRVLEPGGRLALTVPLAWQLHELPYDYYRYTSARDRASSGEDGVCGHRHMCSQ